MSSCLQVNIQVADKRLEVKSSLICEIKEVYFPLIVDEGYLYVEENGNIYYLCVDKR